ncbi:MAG: alpha/beta fold hydrolase [Pseudomonadota bacterium]
MEWLEAIEPPEGIRSRFVKDVNGLTMHVLEAGYSDAARPTILLLHGFPELAYSWRGVMQGLAQQGYHAIAPDQRGYGRTTGWAANYDADLRPFYILNLVRDAMALLGVMGKSSVEAVVGHDFGSPVAAYCALARPDIFRSVALMSAPFAGPPPLFEAEYVDMVAGLAALMPAKKHYQRYYSTPDANTDMLEAEEGLHAFLRTYFHAKSANWAGNDPYVLNGWTPAELAKMPSYYIMDHSHSMPTAIRAHAPTRSEIDACDWLTSAELAVYVAEFERTGFQGGLNWYRCSFLPDHQRDLRLFSGRTIDVPSCFISGEKDWGVYQVPGSLERMQNSACSDMRFIELVSGAGHWVQQEKTDDVVGLLDAFMKGL